MNLSLFSEDNKKMEEKEREKMGIKKMESFNTKGKFYEVDIKNKTCTCPAFQKGGNRMCKHLQMAIYGKVKTTERGFSKSLLKSGVQKAIRRNEPKKAVGLTKTYINKYPGDFFRRLAVIILEDVILHPDFREIVELSSKAARKSYILSKDDEKLGMRIVEQLARCEFRDAEYMEYQHGRSEKPSYSFSELKELEKNLTDEEINLVKAINWRGKMGGMGSDITMFELSYTIWVIRFANKEITIDGLKQYFPSSQIDYDKIGVDENDANNNLLIESVDFHCSPLLNILLRKDYVHNVIKKEFGYNVEVDDKLKDIVWRLRSAVNHKKDAYLHKEFDWLKANEEYVYNEQDAEKYIRVYGALEKEVDNISSWFIKKSKENNN